MSDADTRASASGVIILKLVWGGLLVSQLVFVGILRQVVDRRAPVPGAPDFMLLQWLGVALGAVSIEIFRKKLSPAALSPMLRETAPDQAVGKVLPWCLAVWVLNEGVMMLGFVHGFLAASFQAFLPSLAVSVLLQLAMFPRLEGMMRKGGS